MTGTSRTTLPFTDLETAYELLAQAIDSAGPEREAVFMARLALLMAHETGDLALFRRAVTAALMGNSIDRVNGL